MKINNSDLWNNRIIESNTNKNMKLSKRQLKMIINEEIKIDK